MWENIVERGRVQMTIWRMRIACWTTAATDTCLEYVILTAFPLQQWLQERPLMFRNTIIVCRCIAYGFGQLSSFAQNRS